MKNLAIFCDGTWNTEDQQERGVPTPTNVVRLRNCVADSGPGGVEQRHYYHGGVGTEGGLFSRTAGGAWGQGLSNNVKSAYHWLARNYAPGDRVFLFGFSRGAYTVRSLGGLLGKCGLPDLGGVDTADGWKRVDTIYDKGYREGREPRTWNRKGWPLFHDGNALEIAFLGVWDTVGALGVPDDLALLNLLDQPENWRFHDTGLGRHVRIARHALALDEMRASFTPTLWTEIHPGSDVRQIWFPGVHSDVGGGYPETGLSDGALRWMIDEAAHAGLGFRDAVVAQIRPDPRGVLHDSVSGVFEKLRTRPRNAPAMRPGSADLHPSAWDRHDAPPITQGPYRPTHVLSVGESRTVDVYAREHWNATGLYLPAGSYAFEAVGQWLDRDIPCGPRGCGDGKFHVGELGQMLGTSIGLVERGWRKVTGNETADFQMTRRHEDIPWLALVGAIANAERAPQQDGTPAPHQTFRIGDGTHLELTRPGYLYAYANDAWLFYDNNKGSVRLTVRCLAA